MENDIRVDTLMNTLNEITNVCPDIRSIFIFKENGDIIIGEEIAREKVALPTVHALQDLLEKAQTLGGIQNIVFEGTQGTLRVASMKDSYLVTVTSEGADSKYANTLASVLVRTVFNLLERFNPALNKESLLEPEEPRIKPDIKPIEEAVAPTSENHEGQAQTLTNPERSLLEPQVNQLIVEKTDGLFAPANTVRIDEATISQWLELYDGKEIEEVTIETFGGKTEVCKLKPIKGSKYEGKGLIQIPEKIQKSLEVKKGELVRVKPVIG